MHGRWHLTVTEAIHTWDNRFLIDGAAEGNGIYPPDIGTMVQADGLPGWELRAEHINPANPGFWQTSNIAILNRRQLGADLFYLIGAEDPLPHPDFEDIQWEARFTGRMMDIPYRPYAVRTDDLFQMPDGIFETTLQRYYMGVRVRNTWGEALDDSHVLDISPAGRAELAARGVEIIDSWTEAELSMLGQRQLGTGMILGPLRPGESRTVFFKIDVTHAAPRKHPVEFICLDMDGTPDPANPKRLLRKAIYVSRSYVDKNTGELVSEVRQGTLRMKLHEVAYDQQGAKKGRQRKPKAPPTPSDGVPSLEELRRVLDDLLAGRRIDPCQIQRIIACYCATQGNERDGVTPYPPSDGRFTYDPFYIIPTKFSVNVTPRQPYTGQYGPLPYDDPWWKVLLAVVAALLMIGGMLVQGSDVAYQDEDIVIGTLERWQQNEVDAALTRLRTDRDFGFLRVLDAQSGELNENPVEGLDGVLDLSGPIMTRADVNTILLTTGPEDPQRAVFKSGARTGLTHGFMNGLSTFTRDDDGTEFSIGQLVIVPDASLNDLAGDKGDSGSVWVHTATRRPVALNHSGNDSGTAFGSLLEDVLAALNITI
jgi:hypothetical protein